MFEEYEMTLPSAAEINRRRNRVKMKKYRVKNRVRHNRYQRDYRIKNPEKVKEYDRTKQLIHSKRLAGVAARRRKENPEKCREIVRKSYHKHIDKRRKYDNERSRTVAFKVSQRRYRLKARFGITVEQYDALLLKQGNGCAICGKEPRKKRLNVDHDHVTGKVRGLLCYKCNTGLGLLKDSVSIVRRAADYLERTK